MPSLPDFRPVPLSELRTLWRQYPGEDVRRLILEIQRSREIMKNIDALREVIARAWKADIGGHLPTLHQLRLLMQSERERITDLPGLDGSGDR